MSPNSSAWLPWSLWSLLLLSPVARVTSSAPVPEASSLTPPSLAPPTSSSPSTTLLFSTGALGANLRNCSCPAPAPRCDEALANALCSCRTLLRSALPPAGPEAALQQRLDVWVKELWLLEELLNGSAVAHLQLSFCGGVELPSRSLALRGLRSLGIHSAAPHAAFPNQEVSIPPPPAGGDTDSASLLTVVDVALLGGGSALKAYTVVGARAQMFPLLPLAPPPSAEENLLVTFIY